MPYDYEDISMLNDEALRELAIQHNIQAPALEGMIPADRHRLIAQLRKKGINTRGNTEIGIEDQIAEYQQMFPNDQGEHILYLARVPPQTGVRGGTTTGDYNTWVTVYTTPGAAAFLEERGYELRSADDMPDNGVVVKMPRHRRRAQAGQVQIAAPYGQHHIATVTDINTRQPM